MLCHGSDASLYLLAVVVLSGGFSIVLQVSPTGQYLPFYKQTRTQPSKTVIRYSYDRRKCRGTIETQTVFETSTNGLPWFFGDVLMKTRHGQPPPLPQSSIINRRPAPQKRAHEMEIPREYQQTDPWRPREFGFVPRTVYVENQSPSVRAPQPRVARDSTTIRPAPPYEDQTRLETACAKRATIQGRKRHNQGWIGSEEPSSAATQQRLSIHETKIAEDMLKSVRPCPSYRVRRKHDRSKDGWKRNNQGWLQVQTRSVFTRRKFLEGTIRWKEKNLEERAK